MGILTDASSAVTGTGIKTSGTIRDIILNGVTFISGFVGILAVGAIIWGGIMYIMALGDEKKTAKAKAIIIGAVVGIVLVGISFLIVQTVGTSILGATK